MRTVTSGQIVTIRNKKVCTSCTRTIPQEVYDNIPFQEIDDCGMFAKMCPHCQPTDVFLHVAFNVYQCQYWDVAPVMRVNTKHVLITMHAVQHADMVMSGVGTVYKKCEKSRYDYNDERYCDLSNLISANKNAPILTELKKRMI